MVGFATRELRWLEGGTVVMSRTVRTSLIAAAAAAALHAGHTFAQAPAAEPQADAASAPTDEVIVRGRRMSDVREELRVYVDKFVTQVVKTPGDRGYARWQGGVCVSVTNLKEEAAQYL